MEDYKKHPKGWVTALINIKINSDELHKIILQGIGRNKMPDDIDEKILEAIKDNPNVNLRCRTYERDEPLLEGFNSWHMQIDDQIRFACMLLTKTKLIAKMQADFKLSDNKDNKKQEDYLSTYTTMLIKFMHILEISEEAVEVATQVVNSDNIEKDFHLALKNVSGKTIDDFMPPDKSNLN